MEQMAIALNKGNDGSGTLCETAGTGIGPIVQFLDGLFDAFAKLGVYAGLVIDNP
jgi:hypothetical protein